MKLIEEKFHRKRFALGMTVSQVAAKSRLNNKTIYLSMCDGRRLRWDTLLKICDALECSPSDISDVKPVCLVTEESINDGDSKSSTDE